MKSSRIALVQVGHRRLYKIVSPPLGLLYLAGYVRSKLDTVIQLIDQRAENAETDDIVRRIVAFEPDVIGLSCLSAYGYMLRDMVEKLREAIPRCLIVLGGAHPSAFGAQTMLEEMPADAVVVGEGELMFEAIVQAYQNGAGFNSIPGLIWRSPDAVVVTNPGMPPFIDDLDTLPFPAYDLIDVRAYWPLWGPVILPPPRRYISLFTSRGCPYHCIYCHRIFGKRVRVNSPERIVDEIEYYVRQFGVEEIEFLDDIFNFDPRRVFRVAELMRQRNLKLRVAFPNALRTDLLTEDIVEALASMGTYFSALALESGSPRIQEFIGKRLNIPRYLKGVELAARRGIFTSGFMMFGFPTETEAEMRETIEVVCQSDLHHALFFKVTPYPNTPLYDLVRKTHPEKLADIDYANTNHSYRPAANLSEVSNEVLLDLLREVNARFYLNPRRIYRLLRDFPRRTALIHYFPELVVSLTRRSFPNWRRT